LTKPVERGRARLFERPDVLLVDADASRIKMPAPPPLAMAHTAVPEDEDLPPEDREPGRPDTGHLDFRPARIFVGTPPSAKVSLRERLAAAGLATPVESSEEELPTLMAAAQAVARALTPPPSEAEVRKLWEDLDADAAPPPRVVPVERGRRPLVAAPPTVPQRPAAGDALPPIQLRPSDLSPIGSEPGGDRAAEPEAPTEPARAVARPKPRSGKRGRRQVEDGAGLYVMFAGLVLIAGGIWLFIFLLPQTTPEVEERRAQEEQRAREVAAAVEEARADLAGPADIASLAAPAPTGTPTSEPLEPAPVAPPAGAAANQGPGVVASMAPPETDRAPTAAPALTPSPQAVPAERPPGLLRITSDKKAAVVVDGKPQGTVSPEAPLHLSLAAGDHRLRVTPAGGGRAREQMVRVDSDAASAVDMDFVPNPAPAPTPPP
jgi:hypothetical protein